MVPSHQGCKPASSAYFGWVLSFFESTMEVESCLEKLCGILGYLGCIVLFVSKQGPAMVTAFYCFADTPGSFVIIRRAWIPSLADAIEGSRMRWFHRHLHVRRSRSRSLVVVGTSLYGAFQCSHFWQVKLIWTMKVWQSKPWKSKNGLVLIRQGTTNLTPSNQRKYYNIWDESNQTLLGDREIGTY